MLFLALLIVALVVANVVTTRRYNRIRHRAGKLAIWLEQNTNDYGIVCRVRGLIPHNDNKLDYDWIELPE